MPSSISCVSSSYLLRQVGSPKDTQILLNPVTLNKLGNAIRKCVFSGVLSLQAQHRLGKHLLQ